MPARLHIVTGKGGTGKTTVAAALAIALAAPDKRVLLVEVEGRQGIASLFGTAPLDYTELVLAESGPRGQGRVHALAIDPEAALLEYLELFYKLGPAGRGLRKMGAIEFATTIAPGIRDVLLTGKAYEAVRRRDARRQHVYDAVVMDAPPTGRIGSFLNINAEVEQLARVGPIHSQAASIMRVLRSPQTAVHFVALPEELPVQETADGIAAVHALGLPVGAVVLNRTTTPRLSAPDLAAAAAGTLARDRVAAALAATRPGANVRSPRAGGAADDERTVDALLAMATDHARRVATESRHRDELGALGRPVIDLTRLPGGVDLAGLYGLADTLGGRLPGLLSGGDPRGADPTAANPTAADPAAADARLSGPAADAPSARSAE